MPQVEMRSETEIVATERSKLYKETDIDNEYIPTELSPFRPSTSDNRHFSTKVPLACPEYISPRSDEKVNLMFYIF